VSPEEPVLEREYTIPLRGAWKGSRTDRAEKAIRVIRQFAKRHMKSSEIRIENEVNQAVWSRGIQKPPRKIRVLMKKDKDDLVTVSLPGLPVEEEKEDKKEKKDEKKQVKQAKEEKEEAERKSEEKPEEAK